MFCIQCEETAIKESKKGCQYNRGNCGKTAEVSDLQDYLIAAIGQVSYFAQLLPPNEAISRWCFQALFATLTNVNFDAQRILSYLALARQHIRTLKVAYEKQQGHAVSNSLLEHQLAHSNTADAVLQQAATFRLNKNIIMGANNDKDCWLALRLLTLYGLKGSAAYLEHAAVLQQYNAATAQQFHRIMAACTDPDTNSAAFFSLAIAVGRLNYEAMTLLDTGATRAFGAPTPTAVSLGVCPGKAILVSGHDFHDLALLLQQTVGTGISVYTHGEMLPAHGYPQLKKYPHLVANFGGAWYQQQSEFATFPGPILMTSNCLLNPHKGQYQDRLFTRSSVGWPGVKHLVGDDFSEIIACALHLPGFMAASAAPSVTVGYGHHSLVNLAPKLIEQIRNGHIAHIFVIGGCDGKKSARNYYAEIAKAVPKDSLIITLGCGKYRFYDLDLGHINGVPRLMDSGQCNDAYSVIELASFLVEKLECSLNELPLTIILSWFEQKATAVLLTLLSLGIKRIYIGPTLPAFLTEDVAALLQQRFDLHRIGDVATDLARILHPVAV